MKRRTVLGLLVTSASLTCGVAAQNTPKVARIGWLTAQPASSLAPFVDAFRDALATLGYVEGRNLLIAFRYGDGAIERVPSLAAELAGIPVDLIVAQGDAAFEIHKLALPLPIVYAISADPISGGLADSLSRPRDNMTGITLMAVELNGKRLELLRDIVPEIRRVAIVGNPEHPGAHLERTFSEQTARRLGLQITYFPTATRDELDRALTKIAANPPQAISLLADGFAIEHRARIIDFAMRSRVPVVSGWPIFARRAAGPIRARCQLEKRAGAGPRRAFITSRARGRGHRMIALVGRLHVP